jgi:hypothetical protein
MYFPFRLLPIDGIQWFLLWFGNPNVCVQLFGSRSICLENVRTCSGIPNIVFYSFIYTGTIKIFYQLTSRLRWFFVITKQKNSMSSKKQKSWWQMTTLSLLPSIILWICICICICYDQTQLFLIGNPNICANLCVYDEYSYQVPCECIDGLCRASVGWPVTCEQQC